MAYTFQAIPRHNPDRMKAHATEAMPLAFLAMHEAKNESNTDILEVWDEVWTDGTPGKASTYTITSINTYVILFVKCLL